MSVLCDTFAPAEVGAKCEALAGQPSRHEGVPSHGERVAEHTSTLSRRRRGRGPGSTVTPGHRLPLVAEAAEAETDAGLIAVRTDSSSRRLLSVLCSTIHNEGAARMSHGWGARAASGGQ